MRISTKCSIAIHCLIFIYEYENKVKVTSELLSKSTGCNSAAIRSILKSLQKANIIIIIRGIGGAHLMQDPKVLTVWDVYHAIEPEGLAHLIGFHPNPSVHCPIGRRIEAVLKEPYEDVGAAVKRTMREITLQQLLDHYHNDDQIKLE